MEDDSPDFGPNRQRHERFKKWYFRIVHIFIVIVFVPALIVITWSNIAAEGNQADHGVLHHLGLALLMAAFAGGVYLFVRFVSWVLDAVTDLLDAIGPKK